MGPLEPGCVIVLQLRIVMDQHRHEVKPWLATGAPCETASAGSVLPSSSSTKALKAVVLAAPAKPVTTRKAILYIPTQPVMFDSCPFLVSAQVGSPRA